MSEGKDDNEFPQGQDGTGGNILNSGKPAVAAAPKKLFILVVLGVVFIIIVIKSLFFSSGGNQAPVKQKPQPVVSGDSGPIPASQLPQPPVFSPVQVPAPPPPAPPPQTAQATPKISAKQGPDDQKMQARIHSPMFAGGGGGSSVSPTNGKKKKSSAFVGNDPNSSFAQSIEETNAETVEATKVSNLDRTIIQGKIIEAVLETAIDSTLPGQIRAIVSHDTYAEAGRSILIPKGSRLVGVYNANVKKGQARVYIIWTRVIRPDGVDVAINSPGIDSLGRAGMEGDVDNKYFETFSTAIFTSSLDIGIAALGDALFGNQQQTTTTGGGGTTTTSSPTATAMQTAVQTIGEVGKSIVGSTLNLQPTIYIDQGEKINIFVNKDLVFPYGINGETDFIP